MDIERGSFYLADLNPKRGTEPGKTRPVLVVQTDLLTRAGHPSCVVLPLTTQTQDDAVPLRVRISAEHEGFNVESDLMTDQIRAIDSTRLYRGTTGNLIKRIGPADPELMQAVEQCLLQILELGGGRLPPVAAPD
ncbi:MAG: type II toxin-antitoxin system PemK/MazF family toxin [Candidatus Latescibacteria bacterium]|jgi:mRNA interferase MazF|nr:type II toxin-antitoxin system PemK/MazF family toxin [Candidatus Latescibacterota bacterium]